MSQSFATKLALTAVLLGCSTRKELGARFRAVNPTTEFDLERSFKWLQGRVLPRSQSVYEDWARLLGTARSGTWLAACSVEAFLDEVTALFGTERVELEARAGRFLGKGVARAPAGNAVAGSFVAYSWAWSPYQAGKLIRGQLDLRPGARGKLSAAYHENLPGGGWRVTGTAAHDGRILHVSLGDQAEEHLSLSLLVPGRPASVLGGRMQGTTVTGPERQISGSQVVMLRVAKPPEGAGDCYLADSAEAIAPDLAAHGFEAAKAGELAVAIRQFLAAGQGSNPEKVTPADLSRVAEIYQQR